MSTENSKNNTRKGGILSCLHALKWQGMREVDRVNERRLNGFAMLWAGSLLAVSALVAFLDLPQAAGWALALIPLLFGLLTMRAGLKFLREADEMLRQIQYEAMAVGFGTGMVIGMAIVVVKLPPEWIAAAITAPMCFAYVIRVILAARELASEPSD